MPKSWWLVTSVVITAAFRTLYVFVVIEIGSRKILHQTSLPILRRRKDAAAIPGSAARRLIPTASSSMIAIASLRRKSIRVSPTWARKSCGRERPHAALGPGPLEPLSEQVPPNDTVCPPDTGL
jgi:hypothetical protein